MKTIFAAMAIILMASMALAVDKPLPDAYQGFAECPACDRGPLDPVFETDQEFWFGANLGIICSAQVIRKHIEVMGKADPVEIDKEINACINDLREKFTP
jgi:hypothetical protein